MSEARMAKLMAMGICAKNSPVLPVMMSMGRNAATVVVVADMTGRKTSDVPFTMAFSMGQPSCTWR